MTDLSELLERVKAATGPDRLIDRDISVLPGGPNWVHRKDGRVAYFRRAEKGEDGRTWAFAFGEDRVNFGSDLNDHAWPTYTTSVDAALAFAERVLPGWATGFDAGPKTRIAFVDKHDFANRMFGARYTSEGANIPLAILAATLTALISQENAQ